MKKINFIILTICLIIPLFSISQIKYTKEFTFNDFSLTKLSNTIELWQI